jgi:hypothetical protein
LTSCINTSHTRRGEPIPSVENGYKIPLVKALIRRALEGVAV